ncbi:MAG: energy transducer TonB [Woeseiaceae bacterium]
MWTTSESARLLFLVVIACACTTTGHAVDDQESRTGETESARAPSHTVIPEYPEIARRDRIEGEVQVCFNISRAGVTHRIAVRKSTHRLFEKPAIRAVRASTYAPIPRGTEVPAIKACRTFRFTLEPVVVEKET